MHDNKHRMIDYLRISITDRCNLRCVYCMPAAGIIARPHEEILRYEEIVRLVKIAAGIGIKRVRLTGGEPLVRRGIVGLVQELAAIPGINDISLTTNGVLLGPIAGELKQAGLKRVNISIDTLDQKKFQLLTRGGNLAQVWDGIRAAIKAGLKPIKLNVVAMKGRNDNEIVDFAALTRQVPLHIRFIELMPLGDDLKWAAEHRIPEDELKSLLAPLGALTPVTVEGGGPARYYKIPGAKGSIGFISALSEHFCAYCNRLRLTADGKLRPCLASNTEFDIKSVLRAGGDEKDLQAVFVQAIASKPEGHQMEQKNEKRNRIMSQIGG